MPVYFNYFEELSENKFLLKHLDQQELYLVIEYNAEPTFFLSPDRSLSFQGHSEESHLFTLKSIKNYTPLSQKIARTNPIPWGAYVLSLSAHHHTYHFVYEILDPQGQALTTAQFEKVFQKSHPAQSESHPEHSEGSPSAFLKTRLYEAYKNASSQKTDFGELQTGALRNIKLLPGGQEIIPSDNCLRFPLKLNDPFKFSATLEVYNVKLFLDHFEKSLIRSDEDFVFDGGKVTSYLAMELEIASLKTYKILIRNGRPKEKIWDSTPLPFEKLKSLKWEEVPTVVHQNMLQAHCEDDDLFWGITEKASIYSLPLNFYYALTLQRLPFKEPLFRRYIENSLKTISFGYYLYEKDPRYSEWFHLYFMRQLGSDDLRLKLKDKYDEFSLKPQNLWSSIDALECLNACYVAEHEKRQEISKIALDFSKSFQKRLEAEPYATAYHARLQEKKKVETCSPQGLAVLAMLKGFEFFQEASFKKSAQNQLEFLLKCYPIEEQTFILGEYDTSAPVNTTAALQKATDHFPEYKEARERAKQRILEEWIRQSPFLPLSTQLEVAELTMTGFYGYF